MILYLNTTVLCGPVLGFTAVLAWIAGRQFLVSPKQQREKKNKRQQVPPNARVTPNIPKAVVPVPTA